MFKKVMRRCSKQITLTLLSIGCALSCTAFAQNGEGIQVYQKNIHLSAEHKQKLADDITRYQNADNLWDVLREEFTLPHYEDNPIVQAKIEWYMNNQDYLLRSASRAAPYLYYILQQVRKRHLPAELVLLPIVESGYNPFSLSTVGAAGIWQLMPGTASGLGIKRDWWYDGRRDVIASTRAALNYLAYLQSFFDGNWLWAIAAYNTGEGNVLAAIKRNIRAGKDTNFWLLPVAQETRDYVPSLLALATIISHPDQYPIYFPPVRNAPYLAQVDIGTQINLKFAAQLAGISFKKMQQLNSGFTRPSTSSKGPYKLVLPIENVEQFTENLGRTQLTRKINWIHYTVKSGDTLASIAKKNNTSIAAIRKLNHLGKNSPRRGTDILIPYHGQITLPRDDMLEFADNDEPKQKENDIVIEAKSKRATTVSLPDTFVTPNGKYTLQPGDTIYMVRAKDTLESIAQHFRVNSAALRASNQLGNGRLEPGKQLIIPTHVAANTPTRQLSSGAALQPGDTVYMVRHGDTIEKIARKFGTSPAAIRVTNLVDNSTMSVGDKLIIPTHLRG